MTVTPDGQQPACVSEEDQAGARPNQKRMRAV